MQTHDISKWKRAGRHRTNRKLFYGNYHSFDQQLCQKISKGTDFSFIHQALVPGYGHNCAPDKKQDQMGNRMQKVTLGTMI